MNAQKLTPKPNWPDYGADWAKVDSLFEAGLPREAQVAITAIYEKAAVAGHWTMQVKATIHEMASIQQLSGDTIELPLQLLHKRYMAATGTHKAVLASLLAEALNGYKGSLWNRKVTEGLTWDYANLNQWDNDQLSKEILRLLQESVADDASKQLAAAWLDPITISDNVGKESRPAVWNYLAHQAINVLLLGDLSLNEPSYKFYLKDDIAFAQADAFMKAKFDTKDSTSSQWQIIKLYQQILEVAKGQSAEALDDVDFQRLRYVYEISISAQKDSLFESALRAFASKSPKTRTQAFALIQIGSLVASRPYNPKLTGDLNRTALIEAKQIYEQVVADFPKTDAANAANAQIGYLNYPSCQLNYEQTVLPQKPIMVSLNWKNATSVHVGVRKIARVEDFVYLPYEEQAKFFSRLPIVQETKIDLPDNGDFRNAITEYGIPGLEPGVYMLYISKINGVAINPESYQLSFTYVSSMAVMQRVLVDELEVNVVNRETGEPISGARVELMSYQYNNGMNRMDRRAVTEGKTNADGAVYLKGNTGDYMSVSARVTKGKEVYDFYNANMALGVKGKEPEITDVTDGRFFLDRSIYRPGQTLYFKTLLLTKKSNEKLWKINPDAEAVIQLIDVNGTIIDQQTLKSNAFGSVSGNFVIPSGSLNGSMTITCSLGGVAYFSTEAYKRPKFEMKFDTLDEAYRLGQEIKVSGYGQGYAGDVAAGARVQYHVTRMANYPYWPWYMWNMRPQQSSIEIAQGELIAGDDGRFEVPFTLSPDPSVSPEQKATFSYIVSVDVTDANGETRSGMVEISAGYVALQLEVELPEEINKQSPPNLVIKGKNLNGGAQRCRGTVSIWELKMPTKAYVDRFWDAPTTQIMSREAYEAAFPNFSYQQEDKPQNWAKGELMTKNVFDTDLSGTMLRDTFKRWKPGAYRMEIQTEDPFGVPISVMKQFYIYDPASTKNTHPNLLWAQLNKETYQPGDTLLCSISTAAKDLRLLVEIERDGQTLNSQRINLKGQDVIDFEIEELDRGSITLCAFAVRHNRFHKFVSTIEVPWKNKELDITYETFRDKLLPGQEEQWRVRVRGLGNEKVAAEMLASMYDASLDAFMPHNWVLDLYPTRGMYAARQWECFGINGLQASAQIYKNEYPSMGNGEPYYYRSPNWFMFQIGGYRYALRFDAMPVMAGGKIMAANSISNGEFKRYKNTGIDDVHAVEDLAAGSFAHDLTPPPPPPPPSANTPPSGPRKNLRETVFFKPVLQTDANGDVLISFTMNEALTRWKFMTLAHTKDLKVGIDTRFVTTSKTLMVQPNAPRFFREGDKTMFTAKVSNLSADTLRGTATLQLFDMATFLPIDEQLANAQPKVDFSIAPGASSPLKWNLTMPTGNLPEGVTWRVMAQAGSFADGEENSLPFLTNRMLITESLPLPVRGNQTRTFDFQSLQNNDSKTASPYRLTVEMTDNPAWYAVQALPYLDDYPHDCSEQLFSRIYANALAAKIVSEKPQIKSVFEQWSNDELSLMSKLSLNPELKSALLLETPWVADARNEQEQMQRIRLLFDEDKVAKTITESSQILINRQTESGALPWFAGGPDSWYITQTVLEGLARLNNLGVGELGDRFSDFNNKALGYCSGELVRYYEELKRNKGFDPESDYLSPIAVQYLYVLSMFPEFERSEALTPALSFFEAQSRKFWVKHSLQEQGMIALAEHTKKEGLSTATAIVKSLRDRATSSDELGMYWQGNVRSYYWHQMPIETQSVMVEVFATVAKDSKAVDELRIWLLKNKQTQYWSNTKATASAVYALLLEGSEWLTPSAKPVSITLGKQPLSFDNAPLAATGYRSQILNADAINPEQGKITVANPNAIIAWGAAYYQYFEQLDKVKTFEETPLTVRKQLYKRIISDKGEAIEPIKPDGSNLGPGDLVRVRIELRSDRVMEYVHLKDQRAACFEPVNVLSRYKYQNGLGYYESTLDASTNFFFENLPKGTFIFEYDLRVERVGEYSNGPATIQCMYAPEFSSHSEGTRVNVSRQ